MNFGDQRESANYVDDTNPTGLKALRNYVGTFLYTHGITNGAGGKPYNPQVPIGTPFGGNASPVPVGPDGRRSDIDWGSNASVPGGGVGFMSAAAHGPNMDAMARQRGFKDAATMAAFYQRQQEMKGPAQTAPAQGGSLMQRLFAIHPSVMLGHVLDRWNQADGTQQ